MVSKADAALLFQTLSLKRTSCQPLDGHSHLGSWLLSRRTMTSEPSLLRLVYASQLLPSTTSLMIDQIVRESSMRNAARGITGILALEDNRVCQVLEGPPDAVDRLYGRIQLDERHNGVAELDRRMVGHRAFADWAMIRRPMIDVVMMVYA